jgi:pimeloyl-ACP methyl ester carboxylesterase
MNRFRTSGGEMAYVDVGDGPPVVLLHGFGTSSVLWQEVVPALTPRHRVVVPDLIGFGSSEQRGESAIDARAQAGYVRELLDHLGVDEIAVLGHGVGGVVAALFAIEGRARCLALIDAGAVDPDGAHDPGSDVDLSGLDGIDVPALIVWGEEDPLLPVELADRLSGLLPQAVLVLLPGCAHFVPMEAPGTVAPLVSEFLRSRYLGLPHQHDHDHGVPAGPVPIELRRAGGTRGPA